MRDFPVAVDLFAGAGGLGEGLASAGFDVAAAVELHPQAALTYAFNHPSTDVFFGDVRDLCLDTLARSVAKHGGEVDLLCGGPPCQGFSTAGKKSESDPRNNLFREFLRIAEVIQPKVILIENVPGFKKMYRGRAYHETARILEEMGYVFTDTILDSSNYGVPQRRTRFVLVAWKPEIGREFSWPAPTHHDRWETGAVPLGFVEQLPYVTVEDALSDLAFLEPGYEAHRHVGDVTSDYQADRRNGYGHIFNHLATEHRGPTVEMFSHIPEGRTISVVPKHLRSGKRTMARLSRTGISNAVLALPDDLIHYQHNRVPTVREMARLQSFDDDYVFFGKRTSGFMERRVDVPQYTQVGNAVPPILAKAIGRSILQLLGHKESDLRAVNRRRELHELIQGSSAYSGYTLHPEATRSLQLFDVKGRPNTLPVSTDEAPTLAAEPVYYWKESVPRNRITKWAPAPLQSPDSVVQD